MCGSHGSKLSIVVLVAVSEALGLPQLGAHVGALFVVRANSYAY